MLADRPVTLVGMMVRKEIVTVFKCSNSKALKCKGEEVGPL